MSQRFGSPEPDVGGHHPDVAVRIGEGPCVPPILVASLGDDLGARSTSASEDLVDNSLTSAADRENAFAGARCGHVVLAGDPPEPASRDEHDAETIVDDELEWLGESVVGELPDRLQLEGVAVELERGAAIRCWQADDDGREVHGLAP